MSMFTGLLRIYRITVNKSLQDSPKMKVYWNPHMTAFAGFLKFKDNAADDDKSCYEYMLNYLHVAFSILSTFGSLSLYSLLPNLIYTCAFAIFRS